MAEQLRKAEGTVEFIWDGDGHVLLNIDPDEPSSPHTFEVGAELWGGILPRPEEGDRVEVSFRAVSYEVVDPDSGPSDRERAEVVSLRVLG
jgi:hypothetical protein